MNRTNRRSIWRGAFWSLLVVLTGCASAPDYSVETADAIVDTEKAIDHFYAHLESVPESQRQFSQFTDGYSDVEVQIRALILRTKMQAHFEKGTDMANTLLDLWKKKDARHKQSNQYSDALADADQQILDGLLTSMALVEQVLKGSAKS